MIANQICFCVNGLTERIKAGMQNYREKKENVGMHEKADFFAKEQREKNYLCKEGKYHAIGFSGKSIFPILKSAI